MRRLQSIIFFVLFSLPAFSQQTGSLPLGSPFITSFSDDIYLQAGKNWDIAQGEDGKMYFANNYGIVEFDGYEWERLGQPVNLSELRSFAVHGEQIYMGGTSEIGRFERTGSGTLSYTVLNDRICDSAYSFDDVRGITAFKDKVFFLTDNGIMLMEQDSIRVFGEGIPFQVYTHGIEELVFASSEKGLYRFTEGDFQHLTPNGEFDGIQVDFIMTINPGEYLVGTNDRGVLTFANGRLNLWNRKNQPFFIDNHLTHATIFNKELLLFGSLHAGLIMTDYSGNIVNIINEKDGLPDHNIRSLYKDKLGNIWTAVDGSVSYLELNSPFTVINKKYGLRGEIYTIHQFNSRLYVGTSRGLYVAHPVKDKEVEFKLILNTTGQCWQLCEHQGNLLLAHHNGIYVVQGNQATFIGGQGNWNFAAIPGRDDLLLSGNYTGISLVEKTGNTYRLVRQIDGFHDTAREVYVDEKEDVWVSHGYKGIYKMQLNEALSSFDEIKLYSIAEGLPTEFYNSLIILDDEVLFGTQNGVYQYNETRDSMEPNPLFMKILGDETLIRKMWLMPNGNYLSIKDYDRTDEIALIEVLENGSFSLQETPFQKLRGKVIPAFESVFFFGNQILFGSESGLIIYDHDLENSASKNHECYIDEISLPLRDSLLLQGNAIIEGQGKQTIYTRNNELIKFAYSTSFFENLSFVEFSTYLEGYDQQWQDWDATPEREFVDLPNGDYTFWVKSRNIYGIESATVTFAFQVRPENILLSRPAMFTMLGMSILMALVLLIFFFRTRRLSVNSREIKDELKVHEDKETELKKENELINEKLSRAIYRDEIRAGLIQKLEKLVQGNSDPEAYEKAFSNYKENLKQVQLQLDALDKVQTDDFLHKVKEAYPDLSARELRLCSYLRLNVSSKEIAEYLGISVRGVESLRYRIRKKLNLSKEQDLVEFFLRF